MTACGLNCGHLYRLSHGRELKGPNFSVPSQGRRTRTRTVGCTYEKQGRRPVPTTRATGLRKPPQETKNRKWLIRTLRLAQHPRTAQWPQRGQRKCRTIAGAPPSPRARLRSSPCPGGNAPNRDRRRDRGVCRRSWQRPAPHVPFWPVDCGVFPPIVSCPCRDSARRRLKFSGRFSSLRMRCQGAY